MAKRRNLIGEQFSPRIRSMLESPAYRVLSLSAHRVISRLELELNYHGGQDNGKLPLTTQDFVEYGIHHASVAAAIREAQALGFIKVTERGRGGNAEHRRPNLFRLTFARNDRSSPPSDEWKRIKTIEEAEEIARMARKAKDPRAVAFGERSWRVRKAKSDTAKCNAPTPESDVSTKKVPIPESSTTRSPRNPVLHSISRGGGPEVSAATTNQQEAA